jgi:hypothetical protein
MTNGIDAKYEHRLIAYFDVLGWRARIEASGRDPALVGTLLKTIRIWNERGVPLWGGACFGWNASPTLVHPVDATRCGTNWPCDHPRESS